jgi:hypothetical protein
MIEKLYRLLAPWLNIALKPFGLMLWGTYHCAGEFPTPDDPLKLIGVRLTRRHIF